MSNYDIDMIKKLVDNLENFIVKDLDVIENENSISILAKKSYGYVEGCEENCLKEKSLEIGKKAKKPRIFNISEIREELIEYVDNYIKTYLLLELNIYFGSKKKRDYTKIWDENLINHLLSYEVIIQSSIKELIKYEKSELIELLDSVKNKNDISKKYNIIEELAGINEQLDVENIVNYVFKCIENDNNLYNIILANAKKNNIILKKEINEIVEITKKIPILKLREIYIYDLFLELKIKKNKRLIISNYRLKVDFLNHIIIKYMIKITWKRIQNAKIKIIPEEFINEITMGMIFMDDINNLYAKRNYIEETKINKVYKDRFDFHKSEYSIKFTYLLTNFIKYDINNNKLIKSIAKNFAIYYLREKNIEEDIEYEIAEYIEENIIKTLLYSNTEKLAIHNKSMKSYNNEDENNEYIKLWSFISKLDFYDQGSKNIIKCFKMDNGDVNKFNKYTLDDIEYLYQFRNNNGISKKYFQDKIKFNEFIDGFIKNIDSIKEDYVYKYKIEDLERFYSFDLLLGICRHIDISDMNMNILISELYSMPLLEYRQRIIVKYSENPNSIILQNIRDINFIINETMFNTIKLLMELNREIPLLENNKLIKNYIDDNKSRKEILEKSFKNLKYLDKIKKSDFKYISNIFFDKVDRFGIKKYK